MSIKEQPLLCNPRPLITPSTILTNLISFCRTVSIIYYIRWLPIHVYAIHQISTESNKSSDLEKKTKDMYPTDSHSECRHKTLLLISWENIHWRVTFVPSYYCSYLNMKAEALQSLALSSTFSHMFEGNWFCRELMVILSGKIVETILWLDCYLRGNERYATQLIHHVCCPSSGWS